MAGRRGSRAPGVPDPSDGPKRSRRPFPYGSYPGSASQAAPVQLQAGRGQSQARPRPSSSQEAAGRAGRAGQATQEKPCLVPPLPPQRPGDKEARGSPERRRSRPPARGSSGPAVQTEARTVLPAAAGTGRVHRDPGGGREEGRASAGRGSSRGQRGPAEAGRVRAPGGDPTGGHLGRCGDGGPQRAARRFGPAAWGSLGRPPRRPSRRAVTRSAPPAPRTPCAHVRLAGPGPGTGRAAPPRARDLAPPPPPPRPLPRRSPCCPEGVAGWGGESASLWPWEARTPQVSPERASHRSPGNGCCAKPAALRSGTGG
uniref:Uncharacterized protein LOC109690356 n=1 Tax=Castor canadensis TaxID=51338 RepID=A0A8B7V0I3_CASCN|nr:uncharacterized protein LOC109690356 [Castor canadensis]